MPVTSRSDKPPPVVSFKTLPLFMLVGFGTGIGAAALVYFLTRNLIWSVMVFVCIDMVTLDIVFRLALRKDQVGAMPLPNPLFVVLGIGIAALGFYATNNPVLSGVLFLSMYSLVISPLYRDMPRRDAGPPSQPPKKTDDELFSAE